MTNMKCPVSEGVDQLRDSSTMAPQKPCCCKCSKPTYKHIWDCIPKS